MKHHLLSTLFNLLIAAAMTSCLHYSHTGASAERPERERLTGIGLDADEIALKSGAKLKKVNTSIAFTASAETVRKMFANYLTAQGLRFLGGKYYDHQGQIVSADQTVKLEELRNARTLAEGERALKAMEITTP